MREKDWQGFLDRGAGREIAVAQLAPALVSHLGAADDKVYLHHDYAAKAVNKHGLSAMHFPLIFDTIDFGIAVADRDRHLSFFYFDKETNLGWFQVTVKLALTGRLYVVRSTSNARLKWRVASNCIELYAETKWADCSAHPRGEDSNIPSHCSDDWKPTATAWRFTVSHASQG